jgi:APA family basic amino acid/polyamine antiporter
MASPPAPGKLLSILGLGFGLAGAVGGTIGAGLLRTPGLVAAQLGSPNLVIAAWVVGGLYALLGAICVAELGASLPLAGGWYVYAHRAFGNELGFVVGWIDWLGHCVGLAWVAITIGEYGAALVPDLGLGPKAIALAGLLLFSLIQLLGVRAGSGSQQLLSLAKAVAFLALVAACFLWNGNHSVESPAVLAPAANLSDWSNSDWSGLAIASVLALQAVITTYDGWASPIYFAEEFSEPASDLPRSLLGGVLAVIVIYLLVNLALLHVLPLEQLANSKLPVGDAATVIFGSIGGELITGVALISLLGLVNTAIMAAPRILFGMARDGLFPAFGTLVNTGGTPTFALLFTSLAAIALVLSGSFERLLGMASILYVAIYMTGIAAQVMLRQREPELPRPFRAWGYPVSAVLVFGLSLAFLIGAAFSDPLNSLIALALVAIGALGYLIARRFQLVPA